MKIIYPKGIGEVKELKCDKDETPLEFVFNIIGENDYGLFEYTKNAKFECPVCGRGFLVEDYTEEGKVEAVKSFLDRYDNFLNRLTKLGRKKVFEAKKILNNLNKKGGK